MKTGIIRNLIVFTAAALIADGAWADEWYDPSTGYTWMYRINGDTAEIYKGNCKAAVSPDPVGAVTIPSVLGGKPVTRIGDGAFVECKNMTSVTMPNSVTSIGGSAFMICRSLSSIVIPDGVTSIGDAAFAGCSSALYDTTSCPGLELVDGWVSDCTATPQSGNLNLSGVRGVVGCAFMSCDGLESVTIGEGVKFISGGAFYGCDTLKNFIVADGNANFTVVSGLLLANDGMTLVAAPSDITSVTIPSGVTNIMDYAFGNCGQLSSVTISSNVTDIGISAFSDCASLTSVTIPGSVKKIGRNAFYGCEKLVEAYLPRSLEGSIDDSVFEECAATFKIEYYDAGGDVTVTFDANGGEVGEPSRTVAVLAAVGPLPMPTRDSYTCLGWYTAPSGGTQVTASTKVTADATYYAHWKYVVDAVDGTIVFGTEGAYVTEPDGAFSLNLTELIGSTSAPKLTVKGLPTGLKYDAKTMTISGTATKPGTSVVTISATNATVKNPVTTTFTITVPNLSCAALPGLRPETNYYNFEAGRAFLPGSVECTATDKDWKVAASGLPTGLKFNAKTGAITGVATKPGTYTVTFTATKGKEKQIATITINIAALPDTAVGTFNGFVKADDGEENIGTFQLTTTDAGKLTAKVTTAAGSYSFSGTCWDSVENGVYSAALTTKKGETLTLSLDSSAGWDKDQLTGEFEAVAGQRRDGDIAPYQVVARKNAFGKTWCFNAEGDVDNGWVLSFAENAKAAALTVTLNADGSTKIAGKLGTLSANASGYADVTGLAYGVIYADFAPVVSIKDGKTTLKRALSIRANLWFDRSNNHPEGVGTVKVVE